MGQNTKISRIEQDETVEAAKAQLAGDENFSISISPALQKRLRDAQMIILPADDEPEEGADCTAWKKAFDECVEQTAQPGSMAWHPRCQSLFKEYEKCVREMP